MSTLIRKKYTNEYYVVMMEKNSLSLFWRWRCQIIWKNCPKVCGEGCNKAEAFHSWVHAQLSTTDLGLEEAFVPGGESFSTGMPVNPPSRGECGREGLYEWGEKNYIFTHNRWGMEENTPHEAEGTNQFGCNITNKCFKQTGEVSLIINTSHGMTHGYYTSEHITYYCTFS